MRRKSIIKRVTLNFDDGRTCVPICDRGFSYYGHACWRIQGTFDFFDARESCSSVGAHLAILKDQNHLRAVVDHIKVSLLERHQITEFHSVLGGRK